jgi:NADH-quinone oxidoreductase subunit M
MTVAVLLIPLVGAALVWGLRRPRAAAATAVAATIATFLVALFLPGAASIDLPWLPALGIGFRLDPGGASSVLVLAAALTMIPTVLTAGSHVGRGAPTFLALLLLMQASLNGLFLASDAVLMYVFWEATLIPSLLLLGLFGRDHRRRAVTKYLIYAIAGSFVMLASVVALRPISGATSYAFAELVPATQALSVVVQGWLFAGFTLAFAVKLPLFPLHSWLIDFHRENHPSGAADVAGTLYKVGGFGFFAWAIPLLPQGAEAFQPWLLTLAAVTAVWGALAATQQKDLKSVLAYASLSHMGIVGVGVFSLTPAGLNGAMLLLAAQMLSTGGMFLIAGMLYRRRHDFALDAYGGLARSAPALAGVTLLVLFAFIGVPGLSNFPGEFMALLGATSATPLLGGLATLAVIAAGVYGVNVYQRLFQGRPGERTADLRGAEVAVLAPIVAGILWLGLTPAPQLERIETASQVALAYQLQAERPTGPDGAELEAALAPAVTPGEPLAEGGER